MNPPAIPELGGGAEGIEIACIWMFFTISLIWKVAGIVHQRNKFTKISQTWSVHLPPT
jgi:hypothetical protein